MIKYNPQDAVSCWAEGDYPATLHSAKEGTSKAGNDMWIIGVKVYNGSTEQVVTDYIVIPKATYKLKKLARAIGGEESFAAGTFSPADHIDAPFTASLSIEAQPGFDEKNRIDAYLPAQKVVTKPSASDVPADEEIPF